MINLKTVRVDTYVAQYTFLRVSVIREDINNTFAVNWLNYLIEFTKKVLSVCKLEPVLRSAPFCQ